ncbi:hypothetical protein ONS95_006133 [Cadophora gregata]|uniref:uncharacterized protein n=1 Tax=Cadophora gregata TaxID=51156 RepID=UPI0026DAD684|nr:uncharacterized protein ONS95_006133 [Cadophora gregata]KAK0102519.1 hypothetical protein ONS95_006133 [Cadophora gregata]KAK0104146.1 hypothetical protein ONS96_005241 [Cadophora gregata f. sp. sojae]
MTSIFYIEIGQSSGPPRDPRPFSGIWGWPAAKSNTVVGLNSVPCPAQTLATCWEIFFATFGSLLCSSYAIHHEEPYFTDAGSSMAINPKYLRYFSFVLDPSPALMLFACLILGCSISSFAYRRQREDNYQDLIFVLAVTFSTIFGLVLGINANLIMLGLIPWALCIAMMCSVAIHWAARRRTRKIYTRIQCCEFGEKMELPHQIDEKQ